MNARLRFAVLGLWVLVGMVGMGCGEKAETRDAKHQDEPEEGEAHEEVVHLDENEIQVLGIDVAEAGPGKLQIQVDFPGEIVINPDRLAHIVPRVPGVVREVYKRQGDRVTAGEVMAVLESRELSELKSAYFSAKGLRVLRASTFAREERLWKQRISSEREYLAAQQALAESRIELQAAEQKLHALGFSEADISSLSGAPGESFTRYEMVVPFDGTVVEKHVTLGEVLDENTEAFVVADLGTVWVNLTAYQKDLPYLKIGQSVVIRTREGGVEKQGTLFYISPTVDEKTRAATCRVVLENSDGKWRPGLFVNGKVGLEDFEVSVRVPSTALQQFEGRACVFVRTEEGFEPVPVEVGRRDDNGVEIVSGLKPGQLYAARGTFVLRAELEKSSFDSGHNH